MWKAKLSGGKGLQGEVRGRSQVKDAVRENERGERGRK